MTTTTTAQRVVIGLDKDGTAESCATCRCEIRAARFNASGRLSADRRGMPVLYVTRSYPYADEQAALDEARTVAASRGYAIVTL